MHESMKVSTKVVNPKLNQLYLSLFHFLKRIHRPLIASPPQRWCCYIFAPHIHLLNLHNHAFSYLFHLTIIWKLIAVKGLQTLNVLALLIIVYYGFISREDVNNDNNNNNENTSSFYNEYSSIPSSISYLD